ncbi:MAG: hypothetical protein AAF390_02815 [Pseudomonadota bacterium]
MALARILAMLFVALTAIYWCLWMFFRAGERARLEEIWQAEQPPLPRHTFVDIEMQAYQTGLRRKLIFWVYGVPMVVATVVVTYLNTV